jgi:hypothetical protein
MGSHYAERKGDEMKVSGRCPFCGKIWSMTMSIENYVRWQRGKEYVQNIFTEMSPDNRELLINGVCCG